MEQRKGSAPCFGTIQAQQLFQIQKICRPDKQWKEFCKETVLKIQNSLNLAQPVKKVLEASNTRSITLFWTWRVGQVTARGPFQPQLLHEWGSEQCFEFSKAPFTNKPVSHFFPNAKLHHTPSRPFLCILTTVEKLKALLSWKNRPKSHKRVTQAQQKSTDLATPKLMPQPCLLRAAPCPAAIPGTTVLCGCMGFSLPKICSSHSQTRNPSQTPWWETDAEPLPASCSASRTVYHITT